MKPNQPSKAQKIDPKDLTQTSTSELIRNHKILYGATFDNFSLDVSDPEREKEVRSLLAAAIAGDREPITDSDLGIIPPPDPDAVI